MMFRESPSGQQSAPPWSFPGMTLQGFALSASTTALSLWCSRTLDDVSDSRFTPALPIVFLCVASYPKMFATNRPELGFSMQSEYFVMFPVVRSFRGIFPLEVGWAYPFMGVDNGTSVVSGQMVVGLPKVLGEFDITATPNGFSADVRMLAVLSDTPTSQQAMHPLLSVRASNAAASASAATSFPAGMLGLPTIDALLGADVRALIEAPLEEAADMAGAGFGLRQLRDCASPERAAFMDIVRMRWQSSNERDFQLWQDATVDIFDNATFPISDTLGLAGGTALPSGGVRYRALAAYSLTLDLAMSAASLPPRVQPDDTMPMTPADGPI